MDFDPEEILSVLDRCCDNDTFPMLDNGYVYLAGTRLSLYRSATDWAIVIEVFGFSLRSGLPDTQIHTFASQLHDRDPPEQYVSREAYENYLVNNPHNDTRFVFPIDEGPWQDPEDGEFVADRGMASPGPRQRRAPERLRNVPSACPGPGHRRRGSIPPCSTAKHALAQLA